MPDLRAFIWPRESIKQPEQYMPTCRVCELPWDYIVDLPDYNEKTGFLYRGIGIPRCAKHAWQLVDEFFAVARTVRATAVPCDVGQE